MPRIKYVSCEGEETEIDAPEGSTVMSVAVSHGHPGIVGECGGSAMCATCHVYVDPEWAEALPEKSEIEDEMLDSAVSERRSTSRLGCQLTLSEELDGLVVHLPEHQV